MVPNFAEARQWLELLYGDTPGFIHICATGEWDGRAFEAKDTEGALAYIAELDVRPQLDRDTGQFTPREGIYLRACTLRERPRERKRGSDADSFYLPGLWADIDIAGPGHKTKNILPPNVEEAMAIVAASGLPEPSHWIHSGGGLYPWWLLKEAAEITDLEDFRNLSAGWQEALARGAAKLGYHYGSGIGDLSRVLRIPGTINRKAGLERPCGALEGHAWDGRLYELAELYEALAAVTPEPAPPTRLELKMASGAASGDLPGDDFNRRASWEEILAPLGWQWLRRSGDAWLLRRPGKLRGEASATLRTSTDRLYVFSTEAQPFEANQLYTKFAAFTILEHNGDFRAAARELGRRGYGARSTPPVSGTLAHPQPPPATEQQLVSLPMPERTETPMESSAPATAVTDWNWQQARVAPGIFSSYRYTARGAGDMFAEAFHPYFRYDAKRALWFFFDGKLWREDRRAHHEEASKRLLDLMHEEADRRVAAQEQFGSELKKFATKMENATAPSACRWSRSDMRVSVDARDFDPQRYVVTLANGVLDLKTMQLAGHHPKYMATKMINVEYDPRAKAPRWEKFLEKVLPDVEVRDYVQRAIGHALMGDAEIRALFLLYGPSGTGKSVFIKIMELLFGDFAETAAAATFTASSRGKSLTNDLNDLKGKRFVSISELDQDERLHEAVIKRVTGGDTVKSRGLYQENSAWRVDFSLWMATNYLPPVNSDDNAIWRRLKPIHFGTVIRETGAEEPRLAEKMFEEEASGILNWVLDGVRKYQEHGLDDILAIKENVASYQESVDNVAQFLNYAEEEHVITVSPDKSIGSRALHEIYSQWCRRNNHPKPYGERRFANRMESAGYKKKRTNAGMVWLGIGPGVHGFMGTMPFMRT